MEDVLQLYKLPYDPGYPQVSLDETNKQLIGEVCQALPCQPGLPYRYESHYLRAGVGHAIALYPNDPPVVDSLARLGRNASRY